MFAILLLIILQSLSSGLCLNCPEVKKRNNLGVYVRREPNGTRSYLIIDRMGKEWKLYLNKTNGQIDIESVSEESQRNFHYGRKLLFTNFVYFQHSDYYNNMSHDCRIIINTYVIECFVTQEQENSNELTLFQSRKKLGFSNPLVFKTYPMHNDIPLGNQWIAYKRYNKSERVRIVISEIQDLDNNLYIKQKDLTDIAFIRQMNDSLFSQIDPIIDYNLDHKRGLSGHMLWFNIDHKYYYCFQPEGQPLSEKVLMDYNSFQ